MYNFFFWLFVEYLSKRETNLQTVFFFWKLKSICKFWIQNHFCSILEDWDIWKTKDGFEVDKLIFILTRNSTCGSRLGWSQQTTKGPRQALLDPEYPLLTIIRALSYLNLSTSFIFSSFSLPCKICSSWKY